MSQSLPQTVTALNGQRIESSKSGSNDSRHQVVVVGGGFGGLWVVRNLHSPKACITLIDKRNFHLFQPLLYQVATGGLSPADIASPLRGVLARHRNVRPVMGEVVGFDLKQKLVELDDRSIPYDSLVVSAGTENNFFGNDTWVHHAPGLKSIEDSLTIRHRIFRAFEAAEVETDPERRRALLTFVVVGGGPTGVELAGAIGEISRITLKNDFRSIDTSEASIIIIEAGPRVLATFPESLAASAVRQLTRLGAQVMTGAMVTAIDSDGVTVRRNDATLRIPSRTVTWAAGVKPSHLGRALVDNDLSLLDKTGRVLVRDDFSLPDHPEVFVIGDLANYPHQTGLPLPGVAPVAMSEGRYVARLIERRLAGRKIRPFHYLDKGNLAVIGRAAAIADFGWLRISGYIAWLLWLFVHLMYLVGFDNRLLVFVQWAWNYFTRSRSARLITYDLRDWSPDRSNRT